MTSQEKGNAPFDGGLLVVTVIAGMHGISANPAQLAHRLALGNRRLETGDLVRATRLLGLKGQVIRNPSARRLARVPVPAILKLREGGWAIWGREVGEGRFIVRMPLTDGYLRLTIPEILDRLDGEVIAITKSFETEQDAAFGLSWFISHIKRYRVPLTQVIVISFFVQIFALASPLTLMVIVDMVLVHKSYSTLMVLTVGMILLAMFNAIMKYLRVYALAHTSNRIDAELGARLLSHLFSLPLDYFERIPAGVTVTRLRELETVRKFLTGQGIFSAIDALFFFVFIAVLFVFSWRLTLIVLAAIPLYGAIALMLRPAVREKIVEKFSRWSAGQQFVVESLVGAQTIKAAAVETIVQKQWEERLVAYVRAGFEATVLGATGQGTIEFITKVVTMLILYLGTQEVIDGTMTVGGLIAFNMIAMQITQPILRVAQLWQDFQQVQVSVERLGDILNLTPEPRPQEASPLPALTGAIEFRAVSFRYRPELQEAVKAISLTITPGETVGIVGQSGSGKSTVSKLIQRLYLPTSGQILVDGVDIAQVDPTWLRRQAGVVLQDSLLFNRTIHENIALARPEMSRAEVVRCSQLAGAHDFVMALPLKYDTQIVERGANLSGGQRQRVAIARALATNPRILIFDEATSALDYESEQVIQANMREITAGRTVIIIAHRLAAVRPCDRIVGMHNGEIVEIGSHQELLRRENGLYAGLWALQTAPLAG